MKKLIKKTVLLTTIFSLAALVSIPNIVGSTNTYASIINGEEYGSSEPEAPITVVSTNGNLTNFKDALGDIYTAYTTEVNEYITLQNQGLTKIKTFTTTTQGDNMDNHFITEYFLSGYQKVKLPDNAVIRVVDKYNLELLSLEKYLQGTQKTTNDYYLMKENANKKGQEALENSRKQQAEAKADQQQIEKAYKANEEKNVWSENDKHSKGKQTYLKYSIDYLQNYSSNNLKKNQEKLWTSFDNERNYIQQWLNKHNLTLKQLRDMCYTTENIEENIKKYGKQMVQADIYFKWIENGTLPKNCSYGDWIRYMLRPGNMMPGWNWLTIWTDKIDFGPQTGASGNGWVIYKGAYDNNREVQKMIEEDLPIIANLPNLSKEEKLQMVEYLCGASSFIDPFGSSIGKNIVDGWKSMSEIKKEILNKWNTEYLPSIKE